MFTIKSPRRALLALAIGAALPMAALAQAKDPVRVGLVSSKSGVFAQQGEEVIRAIKFAIDEANAKGARLKWRRPTTKERLTPAAVWPRSWRGMATTC
jgi:ABC-type sugar transport system substrate-binding protein